MSVAERQMPEALVFDHETRRYNDTVTWLAEVLPGSMRTPFEYSFDGQELYASDGGALEPIFADAIEDARRLPSYELRRRRIEYAEYQDMVAMMRGDRLNTMVVVSDFPPELMQATQDVGGYNANRKQTMLRVLLRRSDGTMQMYSQSLDGSDRRALEAVYEYFGERPQDGELLGQRIHREIGPEEQEFLIDNLMAVYDRSMRAQYGGEWHAGRRGGKPGNTYDFVCRQRDLLSAYLASTTGFTGGFRDYSLAAAMKERYLQRTPVRVTSYDESPDRMHAMAMAEMNGAGNRAQALGETFSGCGASIAAENSSATSQLENAGIGNLADKPEKGSEKLVWKKGTCRVENCPTRPAKTDVAQCSVCRGCQAHFDRGTDPAKIYKVLRPIQEKVVNLSYSFSEEDVKKVDKAWLN